jgi:hypothetical protein
MYRNASNIRASHFNFASVEARSQRQPHLLSSLAKGQGASNRAAGSIKRGENAVARSLDQISAMLRDRLSGYLIVAIEKSRPC